MIDLRKRLLMVILNVIFSASGDSFRKIINLDEFDELMSLDDDPYVVANNDIVYDVRKTNYS